MRLPHTLRSFGKPSPKSPRVRRCCCESLDSPSYGRSFGGPRLICAIAPASAGRRNACVQITGSPVSERRVWMSAHDYGVHSLVMPPNARAEATVRRNAHVCWWWQWTKPHGEEQATSAHREPDARREVRAFLFGQVFGSPVPSPRLPAEVVAAAPLGPEKS